MLGSVPVTGICPSPQFQRKYSATTGTAWYARQSLQVLQETFWLPLSSLYQFFLQTLAVLLPTHQVHIIGSPRDSCVLTWDYINQKSGFWEYFLTLTGSDSDVSRVFPFNIYSFVKYYWPLNWWLCSFFRYWDRKMYKTGPVCPSWSIVWCIFKGWGWEWKEGKYPNLAHSKHNRINNYTWFPSRVWNTFKYWGEIEASHAMRILAIVRNWWVNIIFYQCVGVQQNKTNKQKESLSKGYINV